MPGYQLYFSDEQNFAVSQKFAEAVAAGKYRREDIRDFLRDILLGHFGLAVKDEKGTEKT